MDSNTTAEQLNSIIKLFDRTLNHAIEENNLSLLSDLRDALLDFEFRGVISIANRSFLMNVLGHARKRMLDHQAS